MELPLAEPAGVPQELQTPSGRDWNALRDMVRKKVEDVWSRESEQRQRFLAECLTKSNGWTSVSQVHGLSLTAYWAHALLSGRKKVELRPGICTGVALMYVTKGDLAGCKHPPSMACALEWDPLRMTEDKFFPACSGKNVGVMFLSPRESVEECAAAAPDQKTWLTAARNMPKVHVMDVTLCERFSPEQTASLTFTAGGIMWDTSATRTMGESGCAVVLSTLLGEFEAGEVLLKGRVSFQEQPCWDAVNKMEALQARTVGGSTSGGGPDCGGSSKHQVGQVKKTKDTRIPLLGKADGPLLREVLSAIREGESQREPNC